MDIAEFLDFPLQPPVACNTPPEIVAAFDKRPVACLKAEDYIVVFDREKDVGSAEPDLYPLQRLDLRGVAITAHRSKTKW